MKMKKYTADTMVEAMKKVRADFGDDAVILSSNVVTTKGFLGFFRKKSVEVVAGFDGPYDDSGRTSFHSEASSGGCLSRSRKRKSEKK